MDYTITYGGLESIKYRFHEGEVMEKLQHKAREHAQKVLPKNAEMDWGRVWWDTADGELIIEFTCEFRKMDEAKTEAGSI